VLTRRGSSLVELVVALTLTAVVLGAATSSTLQQQRAARSMAAGAATGTQLRPGTAALATQLALLGPDDLVPAELSDSTLQFREVVATGIACDTAVAEAMLGARDGSLPLGGVAAPVRAGDTLWWYAGESWRRARVTDSSPVRTRCGPTPIDVEGMRLRVAGSDTILGSVPLRVTRQERLVIYRGGDGAWMLGLREWSVDASQMAAPQPIAGPFVRRTAKGERTGFRYFDGDGAELWPDRDPARGADVRRVRITLLALRGGAIVQEVADVALQAPRAP
jgi:hypothetical protein